MTSDNLVDPNLLFPKATFLCLDNFPKSVMFSNATCTIALAKDEWWHGQQVFQIANLKKIAVAVFRHLSNNVSQTSTCWLKVKVKLFQPNRFIYPRVISNLCLLWSTNRRYFEKRLGGVHTKEVNRANVVLITDVLRNIFSCFLQTKKNTGLAWHEVE